VDSVEVGGLRIAYEPAGAGPPLVLLHVYVGDGPTLWRPQLDTLSDDFTVIAWDAPGAEDLHRSIAGSTLVLLPGAGHVANLEAPEAFDQAVRSFLLA
jgi:pimeloyl-ACP methyl ester carboxylesterase